MSLAEFETVPAVDADVEKTRTGILLRAGAPDTLGRARKEPRCAGSRVSNALDALEARLRVDAGLGQVSVVGSGMKRHPGVAATAFPTLSGQEIESVIVTTSPIKIAVQIHWDDLERAVRALHDAFGLEAEEPVHG